MKMCVIFFITAISTYEQQKMININNHKITNALAHFDTKRVSERQRGREVKQLYESKMRVRNSESKRRDFFDNKRKEASSIAICCFSQ